ncbi:MAG: alpha/beta fold hydrolase [Flavobacteriales bacterium]|nr:alpha/beta fold hydrolase [Flavobacteriales bacterium]
MSTVPLHHRRMGQGRPLLVLHGLFGSSDNWNSIGKAWAEEFEVVLVDQRDHGRSPHTDRITYALMADDVAALIADLRLHEPVVVGHSMGGKTGMVLAQRHPGLLHRLVVIDMGPREYPPHRHAHILQALTTCDLERLRTRKEVEDHLATSIREPGVVQFLLKSLYWATPEQLAWRFNVPLLAHDIHDILAAAGPEVVRTPTLFIRGGQSDYITREDLPQLREQFPQARVETIDYAGHWVHVQAPDEVIGLVRTFAP